MQFIAEQYGDGADHNLDFGGVLHLMVLSTCDLTSLLTAANCLPTARELMEMDEWKQRKQEGETIFAKYGALMQLADLETLPLSAFPALPVLPLPGTKDELSLGVFCAIPILAALCCAVSNVSNALTSLKHLDLPELFQHGLVQHDLPTLGVMLAGMPSRFTSLLHGRRPSP